MQTQITVEYVILLLLNVSSFLQRERERKKGKKLISVFDRQFETQKLMQKIERQTHTEREKKYHVQKYIQNSSRESRKKYPPQT